MTKEDLLSLAKTYFNSDKSRVVIFGTEDKHFFNSEGDARSYCKVEKKYFKFVVSDFEEKLVVKDNVIKAKTEAEIEKEIEAEIKAEEAAKKKKPKKVIKKKVKK
jgi:hypothetical protein